MNSMTGYKKVRCFRIVKNGEEIYGSIIDKYDNINIIPSTEKLGIATVKTPPVSKIIYLDQEVRSAYLHVEEIKDFDDKIIDDDYRCYSNAYRFLVGKLHILRRDYVRVFILIGQLIKPKRTSIITNNSQYYLLIII
uniref:Uncharacterized protein n=1 Tax=Borely moumouvirus TaxID=2712067 RepID=A0A6G6ACR9_9VIRU